MDSDDQFSFWQREILSAEEVASGGSTDSAGETPALPLQKKSGLRFRKPLDCLSNLMPVAAWAESAVSSPAA